MDYGFFRRQLYLRDFYCFKHEGFNDDVINTVFNRRIGTLFTYSNVVKTTILKMINFHNQNVLLDLNQTNNFESYFMDLYNLTLK